MLRVLFMSRVHLHFDTDNDAFTPEAVDETARILRDVATRIERAGMGSEFAWPIRDVNGNRIGDITYGYHRRADDTLDLIADCLHAREWDSDTCNDIAEIVRETGREIADVTEVER